MSTIGNSGTAYTKEQLVKFALDDAAKWGISPIIFQAQINQESGWNPNAQSPAGAIGIAQFMPQTAAGYGINPWEPVASLDAAAHYDANVLKDIGSPSPHTTSDYQKMLAAYNEGEGAMNNQVAHYGSDWLSFAPLETQNYVKNITSSTSFIEPTAGNTANDPIQGIINTVQGLSNSVNNINSVFSWTQQNGLRVALFIVALILIGAGLFAIGGAAQ